MNEKIAERRFLNELGREIEIDVSEAKGMVMIRISGPSSYSTNLVTRAEAEKLREALNEWAGQ